MDEAKRVLNRSLVPLRVPRPIAHNANSQSPNIVAVIPILEAHFAQIINVIRVSVSPRRMCAC